MKVITKLIATFVLFLAVVSYAQAQYKPLTLRLDDSGEKYVRFIIWHQQWFQATSSGGAENPPNLSVRRSRFLAYAQISPRFLILTHWGLNSLNASQMTANPNSQTINNRSLLFLHDAWVEFAVVPGALHIGSGLHYWNGISRLTNQSTLNMMAIDNAGRGTADARLFPWNTITTSDQFARHMGIYAKGSIGNFAYRVSANNPRRSQQPVQGVDTSYFDVSGDGNWNFAGYFKYDFLDKEGDKLPYFVGSYLGKKEVLSIGAGFLYQPDALKKISSVNGLEERAAVTQFAVDAFYDAPIGDGAINVLAAYYNYDYGGEEAVGVSPGGGLVPSSGSIIYGQLGYMLPVDIADGTRLMPYVTYSSQNLKGTPENSYEFAAGLNWFIEGHHAKITAEYATGQRGAVEGSNPINEIFTVQAHIFL